MIEIALQKLPNHDWRPYSEEDKELAKEYHDFQICKGKISGVKKPRSYQQLKLYFACCKTVAENTDNEEWNTKEKVDFNCRVKCRLIKNFRVVDGVTFIEPRSISYAELGHLESCNYFDQSFDIMAKVLGITREELLENAEG